jgi:ComF family protein
VAETLARFMARHLPPDDNAEGRPRLLVPVRLHRWRIWKRGYNQAALIAVALSRRTGIEARVDLLERVKATPPLKAMSRRERALAVSGAFMLPDRHKPLLEGRRIVLVDDVFTSGATGDACVRALKRAGAAEVEMLCWARVIRTAQDS